jgi:hypothetical protein
MLLNGLYLLSVASIIAGLVLAKRAWRIRKQVMGRYSSDMGKLDDWERALRYTSSGNEEEIKIALDIMWALSNPLTYSEIQPVVNIFVNHSNKEISMRAHQILNKHVASLPRVSDAVPST